MLQHQKSPTIELSFDTDFELQIHHENIRQFVLFVRLREISQKTHGKEWLELKTFTS